MLNIIISTKLMKRLESVEEDCSTSLLGWQEQDDTLVAYTCGPSDRLVPHGLNVVALLSVASSNNPVPQPPAQLEEGDGLLPYLIYCRDSKSWLQGEVEVREVPLVTSTRRLVRISGALPFLCKWDKDEEVFRNNVLNSLNDMNKFSFSFQLKGSLVLLHAGDTADSSQLPPPKGIKSPTLFQLSYHVTGENNNTPIIFMKKRSAEMLKLPGGGKLVVDVLALVDLAHPQAHCVLEGAVRQQLSHLGDCLSRYGLHLPVPYHFLPKPCDHPITVIYPEGISEDQLRDRRIQVHRDLLVPQDRPYFQRHNDYLRCQEVEDMEKRLINPHTELESCDQRYIVATVAGDYAYHHYLQDGIDDSGWGCAYRSLQTIVSWYRLQGYTTVPVPCHRTIQKALVDVGDKPPSFVGSRKWIGSQEIVYTLQQLLKVDSKVMFVSSGSELEEKARDLIHHFETQGTPVMIGGGVLAHTILGVKLDAALGHVQYLVLDPHYTGADNLPTVLKKGWCGWKDNKFWNSNSFYNLCLPQRPNSV